MRVINRLAPPGEIRSVRLSPDEVVVRFDEETFVFRRVKDEDVSREEDIVRRGALSPELPR